jgi:hypothetical protein
MKTLTMLIGGSLALFLLTVPAARAADQYGGEKDSAGPKAPVTGTIEGEVKKVDPNAVIIEKEKDGQEVRLPLHESTHKGPIKEGDKVEAFVTPGGTTTSVQPRTEGFNR